MGRPTQVFVNSSIGTNTGTGTVGDPYGNLQHALNSRTAGGDGHEFFEQSPATDFNLAAALSFTTYGGPTFAQPAIFHDFSLNASGGFSVISSSPAGVHFRGGRLHNCGANRILTLAVDCSVVGVEFDEGTAGAILQTRGILVAECNFHNISGTCLTLNADAHIYDNYFKDETNKFGTCISLGLSAMGYWIERNIFSLNGTGTQTCIDTSANYTATIANNSCLSAGSGTRKAVVVGSTSLNARVINNLMEGWTTGVENTSTDRFMHSVRGNAGFNNTTNYNFGNQYIDSDDNEALGASPFAKSGADTFANRHTYFAPVATGNVQGGAWPTGLRLDKGAVQHADPAGGGNSRRRQLRTVC